MQTLDAARLEPLIGPERIARYEGVAEATESAMRGRTVLNINSTAAGGGVAEMGALRLTTTGRRSGEPRSVIVLLRGRAKTGLDGDERLGCVRAGLGG